MLVRIGEEGGDKVRVEDVVLLGVEVEIKDEGVRDEWWEQKSRKSEWIEYRVRLGFIGFGIREELRFEVGELDSGWVWCQMIGMIVGMEVKGGIEVMDKVG